MKSITADQILKNTYTLGKAFRELPTNLISKLLSDDLKTPRDLNSFNPWKNYLPKRTFFQTEGDLNELYLMAIRDMLSPYDLINPRVPGFINLVDFAMASSDIMGYEEFEKLEVVQDWKHEYPNMFKTLLVWAWG
ncbi:MAG: hypothetical protein CL596_05215 [Alteromonas sp.]|nr:hypothetical protein [Alteromonas sp.]|tara:strand:- start:48 stop:452 length:405 start_codon:yes stop_codon:yes gene_type:complete